MLGNGILFYFFLPFVLNLLVFSCRKSTINITVCKNTWQQTNDLIIFTTMPIWHWVIWLLSFCKWTIQFQANLHMLMFFSVIFTAARKIRIRRFYTRKNFKTLKKLFTKSFQSKYIKLQAIVILLLSKWRYQVRMSDQLLL